MKNETGGAAVARTPMDIGLPVPVAAAAGETIASIAARQAFHLPFIALLNGAPLLRSDWTRPLAADDRLLFIVLPAGGGGVKDVFRFVLQLGVTIAASALLGPGGLGLSGWALRAGVAVATIAGGYLVNALLPQQALASGNYNAGPAASPTYSLTPQGNQARLGAPIPKVYGRHILTPDFAAQPYTEFSGNELYLYQLFSLGLGHAQVHRIDIARTTAWHEDTGTSDAFADIEFEIVPPGQPVTLFPSNVVTSAEVAGQILEGPNKDGDWVGPFAASAPDSRCTRLAVDLVWRGGAGHLGDDGSIGAINTILRIEAQEIDDQGNPAGEWFLLGQDVFGFATRTAQRISLRYEVPEGRYAVRVKRVNDNATETRDWDEVSWDGLRAYLTGDDIFPCQVLAMRARATNQLSSQASRQVSVVQTAMLPVWTGAGWSAPVPTRDIFPAAADILRNGEYGAGRPDDRIDIEMLASLHDTWSVRGDTFDAVLDDTQSIWDVLCDVLRVGRARPVEIGDTVTFVRDEKQTVPKLMITPREIADGGFMIDYAFFDPSSPDDVLIEYVDERTWDVAATVRATLPGSQSANPVRVRVKGIVDRTRAWRYGMYLAAVNKCRREYPSLTVEYDGRILSPMSLVAVSHPVCDWGRPADVVSHDAAAHRIRLSQKAMLARDAPAYMRLRRRDGSPWGPVIVTAGPSAYDVIMDEASLAAVEAAQGALGGFLAPADGDEDIEPTVAVLGSGDSFERDCKVIGISHQGGERILLSLVADDDRVYTADAGDPPPETAPPLLPQIPAGPSIERIDVAVRGTRFAPELAASIRPAAGAQSYIWELSYDHITWTFLQDGGHTTWEGPVEAATVWLRVTAIGGVRGLPVEWFQNLTATAAVPAALMAVSTTAFAQHAWVDFSLPDEDGIKGVIAKVSAAQGFDPEAEGTIVYDGAPSGRVLIDLGAGGEVYARLAAYNVFGKIGLNWTNELKLTARKIDAGAVDQGILDALDAAMSIDGNYVLRKDANGDVGGMVLAGGDGSPLTVAWLVDQFLIANPGGSPQAVFELRDGVVTLTELSAKKVMTDFLAAVWADVGTLTAGKIRSGDDKMVLDFVNKTFVMTK
jgi:hypothetical protein